MNVATHACAFPATTSRNALLRKKKYCLLWSNYHKPVQVKRKVAVRHQASSAIMSYVGLFGWHGSTELLPPCAAPLSVFNKVTLIAWCSVSAWRRPIEYPEEAVTRQLKEAVVFSSKKMEGRTQRPRPYLSIFSCTQQKIVSTTWPTPIRELLFQAVKSACIMQEATVCVLFWIVQKTHRQMKARNILQSTKKIKISRCILIPETRRIVFWRWSCILTVMVFVQFHLLISRWNWTLSR